MKKRPNYYCYQCGKIVKPMVNSWDGQFGYYCQIHGRVPTIDTPEKAVKPPAESSGEVKK